MQAPGIYRGLFCLADPDANDMNDADVLSLLSLHLLLYRKVNNNGLAILYRPLLFWPVCINTQLCCIIVAAGNC